MARGKIDFAKDFEKVKVKRVTRPNEYRQLRYVKLLAEVVKKIIKNNSKILKKSDLSEICIVCYGKTDKIKEIRVRKMLDNELVKQDINNELLRIYTDAGLGKDKIKTLLTNVSAWIDEKKDITNALKLIDKIERANNLTDSSSTRATYRETIDFSKVGKDGQPGTKLTKTLEITKNEAVGGDISPDLSTVNDNALPTTDN